MSNKHWRIAAKFSSAERATLLATFAPQFPNTYCTGITYAYRATREYNFPQGSIDARIYGYHRGEGHDALLVELGQAGMKRRPDGKLFHITLSTADGVPPAHGAIWLTYYPHIMVEWYPHVLTVSTLHPISPDKTLNMVEFYYPEEIVAFEREFVEAQQAAYMETCIEDDEIAERMDAGRKALMARGDNEVGPYQSPMEDGMQHFHEWYRGQMAF